MMENLLKTTTLDFFPGLQAYEIPQLTEDWPISERFIVLFHLGQKETIAYHAWRKAQGY